MLASSCVGGGVKARGRARPQHAGDLVGLGADDLVAAEPWVGLLVDAARHSNPASQKTLHHAARHSSFHTGKCEWHAVGGNAFHPQRSCQQAHAHSSGRATPAGTRR
jgi:hypothetical protein